MVTLTATAVLTQDEELASCRPPLTHAWLTVRFGLTVR
jgi:hypothetical protein